MIINKFMIVFFLLLLILDKVTIISLITWLIVLKMRPTISNSNMNKKCFQTIASDQLVENVLGLAKSWSIKEVRSTHYRRLITFPASGVVRATTFSRLHQSLVSCSRSTCFVSKRVLKPQQKETMRDYTRKKNLNLMIT